MNWFDDSNKNAKDNVDIHSADPPFYQKETDDSNEEMAKYGFSSQSPTFKFRTPGGRPGIAHSSSAEGRSTT